jgi:phytoene synthase
MTEDLDTALSTADPDRWLSSRFVADEALRADLIALYAFDQELARAPRAASNTLLGEIRLTWWREVLDEAFEGRPVRHHPTAQALAATIRRRDLPREPLEAMIDARYRELDPSPMDEAEALDWARDTGGRTAELAAFILDPFASGDVASGGTGWALAFQVAKTPDLLPAFQRTRDQARRARLSAAVFPAVAHAVFAEDRALGRIRSDLGRRARITWAVATGRL